MNPHSTWSALTKSWVISFTPSFSWVTGDDLVIDNRFNGFLVLIETAKAVRDVNLFLNTELKLGVNETVSEARA